MLVNGFENPTAQSGDAVFLFAAAGLVGDGPFNESGIDKRVNYLAPAYCSFFRFSR